MASEILKLHNPVWHSLSDKHQAYAIEYNGIKFYHPNYCPFGGWIAGAVTVDGLDRYADLVHSFYIVGDKPNHSNKVKCVNELVCHQMILDKPLDIRVDETITTLDENHSDELFALVNKVQPGYFRRETSQLGSYFGIFKDGMLVAVTGERMKMDSYTEISAVVTHPSYTGRGYARQLITHTAHKISSEYNIPYLHVSESNTHAIALYEKLGFTLVRKLSLWKFVLNSEMADH